MKRKQVTVNFTVNVHSDVGVGKVISQLQVALKRADRYGVVNLVVKEMPEATTTVSEPSGPANQPPEVQTSTTADPGSQNGAQEEKPEAQAPAPKPPAKKAVAKKASAKHPNRKA